MFSLSTFQCPNCHEYINSGLEKCKYCSVVLDPQAIGAAVELQERVNRACNDASLVRNLTGVMWVGFFVRFIPIVGIVGWILMVIGFFAVPAWLIYWQIRYGGLKTPDVDYKRAKRNALMALVFWILILVVLVLLFLLTVGLLILTNSAR